MKLLIKSARLLNPKTNTDSVCDILVANGIVTQISENINEYSDYVIDAKGKWAAPGLIDAHCHLREPGFEHKETIESGSKSAATGGFTTICAMPNTSPPVDSAETVSYIINKAKNEAVVNVLPVAAITKGMNGKELTDIAALVKSGACAISEDGKTVDDESLMLSAMETANKLGVPVLCHCESKAHTAGGIMNEGSTAKELGLLPISDESENIIIEREIKLAEISGAKTHICHVSTKGGVELIRNAKKRNLSITAEVCPHHFSLTDKTVLIHGANAKMAPPLRDEDDVLALLYGLKDGTIDIIATDHAPHSKEEKEQALENAPFGIIGFETAVALTITNVVNKGFLSPLQMIEKMSFNPSKLLGVDKGCVEAGKIADIVIIDPNYSQTVAPSKFRSKSSNSPYGGMTLNGGVFAVIVGGSIIVNDYKGIWE